MNMTGIIFSNIYDTPMGDRTKKRTVASMPFGGRYRFIDFARIGLPMNFIILAANLFMTLLLFPL